MTDVTNLFASSYTFALLMAIAILLIINFLRKS